MPEVGDAEYLIGYWRSVGLAMSGALGSGPITSTELFAWQSGQGVELTPFEFDVILEMSRSYLSLMQAGSKPECPPPYGDPVNEFDRKAVSEKVSGAFKAFIQAKRNI